MSSIDERVVQMKFDNAQFEKGIKQTNESLSDLKNNLKLDGAASGLKDVGSAADKINLKTLANDVDSLKGRFEGLGTIATGVLIAIGAKIVDLGIQMAKSVGQNMFKGVMDGFAEYELQINSVQTILSNTARYGTDIEQVNAALDELNEYADKTIYNFASMTQNIGTFTVAGIKLEDATAAVKGFSNFSALAGANATAASGAMYQLSQAMSSGVVRLQDWMSIERAGIAGVEFQDALKETARAHGVAIDDIIDKSGSFRNSLAENWLSAEIMTDTLAAATGDLSIEQLKSIGYTQEQAENMQDLAKRALDSATVVKTLTQVFDTYAEAVGSGWASSWRIIFGDFEEAKVLFTEISDILGNMAGESAASRNEQLQIWKDNGGRTAVIDAMRNAFDALMQVITPLSEAWKEVFPPNLGNTLTKISFALRDFTESLKMGEENSQNLKTAATFLFKGLKTGVDIFSGALRVTMSLLDSAFGIIGGVLGLFEPFVSKLFEMANGTVTASEGVDDLATNFIELKDKILTPIIAVLGNVKDAFDELVNGDYSGFKANIAGAFEPLKSIGATVKKNFEGAWNVLQGIWDFIQPFVNAVGDFFKGLGEGISSVFEQIDVDTVLAAINTGLFAAIVLSIKKYFDVASGFIESFGEIFEELTGVLKAMQTDLKAQALMKIAIAIGVLAGALLVLSMINPANLGTAVAGMATVVGALVTAMVALNKLTTDIGAAKMAAISGALILVSGAILILATALKVMSGLSWGDIARGAVVLGGGLILMTGAIAVLAKWGPGAVGAAFAMNLIAKSLVILGTAMLIVANLSWEDIAKGAAVLGGALLVMTGALVLLSKNSAGTLAAATAMVAISFALGMLVSTIAILGLLPWPVLTQGLIALGIILAGLAIAIAVMGANITIMIGVAASLLAIGVAVNLLVGAVAILGTMDIGTLVQGLIALVAVLAILAVAMLAMTGSLVGAAATLVVAAALIVLATAIGILGAMPIQNLVQGLIAMALTFAVLAVAGLLLGPLTPILLGLGAALALVGIGMLAMAAAMLVFSLGLAVFGPAATLAAAGLKVLAAAALEAAAAIPAFLGIAVGLLAFGVGALAAAIGVAALGAGLLALGLGLTLIGATGLIGVTALSAVVKALMKLLPEIPGMLALGGATAVLGAALVVLGAGALLAGAGLLMVGLGLGLVAISSIQAAVGLALMGFAIERMAGTVPQMQALGNAISTLGRAAKASGSASAAAAAGINQFQASLLMGTQATLLFATLILQMFPQIQKVAQSSSKGFELSLKVMGKALDGMNSDIRSSSPKIQSSLRALMTAMDRQVRVGLASTAAHAASQGDYIGVAIVQGMARGLNNGSYLVTNAARTVANRALVAAKDELGVASPAKEGISIGEFFDQGIAIGMLKMVNVVDKASSTVSRSAMDSMREGLSQMKSGFMTDMDINPVIRPVLDLSSARKDAAQFQRDAFNKRPSLDLETSSARATTVARVYSDRQVAETTAVEGPKTEVNFTQNNTSPKALSNAEIYRQTKNGLSVIKEGLKK